jgi:hypothetical protein
MKTEDIIKISQAMNPVKAISPTAIMESAGGLIEKTGDAINKIGTSDDERYAGQAKLENERTERLRIDTNSDSWWAKFVRPGSYLETLNVIHFVFIACTYQVIWGSLSAERYELIEKVWLRLIAVEEIIIIMQVGFYFASRGIEKLSKITSNMPDLPGQKGFFGRLFK